LFQGFSHYPPRGVAAGHPEPLWEGTSEQNWLAQRLDHNMRRRDVKMAVTVWWLLSLPGVLAALLLIG
jgi:hypothetical protein